MQRVLTGFAACSAVVALFVACAVPESRAAVAYSQPHNGSGTLYQSSWWEPDDSDYDQWVWDSFTLANSRAITEVAWRGGYQYGGQYTGSIVDFTVAIYPSIAAGTEPDIVNPPLVTYETGGDADETFAGTFGGVAMYDYHFTLPSPFQAAAGTRYWVQIEAWQHGLPEWGLASATGGNGSHFRWLRGAHMYQMVPGDAAFTLMTSDAATFSIAASASPAGAGSVQGAGAYPAGALVTLVATQNAGFGFVNWTEGGAQVSTNPTYSFTADRDRTLVAHFVTAYNISASAAPVYGGSTTGGGWYNSGATVTLDATPAAGYTFVNWTEFGTPVSDLPTYAFTASASRTLVANFSAGETAVLFDFDNAPAYTSLPIDVTAGGITAHMSATGGGFSIQRADTMGFTPWGFGGNCIYPNSVFPADLLASFDVTLSDFSIMYSPQELGCDDSATMRVTAYLDGAFAGTDTATVPIPGTWPTGTLRIHVAGGFNSVVVHYDARPPRCQDYGPIFLADNMIVTPGCAAAAVVQQPAGATVCATGAFSTTVLGGGTEPLTYRWQAELDPGVWSDLADGDVVHNGVIIASALGSATDSMTLSALANFRSDRGALNLRCALGNACGSATSGVATLRVTATGDVNCDGAVDNGDIDGFVLALLDPAAYSSAFPDCNVCAADANHDSFVDNGDIDAFVACLLGGGCP